MRVLLAEDDPMIGEFAEHALKEASYAVDWIRDGAAATTALQTHSYDVVLLDLGLPKRDGLQVLRTIRSGGNRVPVLIVTARDALEASLNGVTTRLSSREFSLLEALLIRPGAILSRDELEDRIYGWGMDIESNVVEFLICSLRKKLGSDAIKNVRGVGWMVPRGT
jgi:two-component system OmpR family response regulator